MPTRKEQPNIVYFTRAEIKEALTYYLSMCKIIKEGETLENLNLVQWPSVEIWPPANRPPNQT